MECNCCGKELHFHRNYVVFRSHRYCVKCAQSHGYLSGSVASREAVLYTDGEPMPRPTVILPASFDDLVQRFRAYNITSQQFQNAVTMLLTRIH